MNNTTRKGFLHDITGRELGLQHRQWAHRLQASRVATFHLSGTRQFSRSHDGGVDWLDLDKVEQRYLLSCSADATIALHDTQVTHGPDNEIAVVGKIERRNPHAHRYLISCVAWYPVDTGLFASGSFDQEVKLWDTNTLHAACRFVLPSKVYAVAMSSIASSHCLIAAGQQEEQVKLCDPASGAFTHTLTGHRAPVWSICWSLTSEHQLVTGDCSGQMMMWDIRRAGTLHVFDQHQTQRTPRRLSQQQHLQQQGRKQQPGERAKAERLATQAQEQQQRQQSSARAHDGAITAILAPPGGLHYLSAGADSRVRLWDAWHRQHLLVNYAEAHNRAGRGRQLACNDDGSMLFYPSGSIIQVYELLSGRPVTQLRQGHFESINCCCYNPLLEELYSGGNDCSLVAWAPAPHWRGGVNTLDRDNWSDDGDPDYEGEGLGLAW